MGAFLLALVCAAITVASFSCGLTGLGHGIIFQTCWSLMHSWGVEGAGDLRVGVAVSFLMGPVTSAYLGPAAVRGGQVRWELVAALAPGTIIAQYIGTAALVVLNQDILKKGLGLLFFAFALWRLSVMFRAMATAKREEQDAFLAEVKQRERREAEASASAAAVTVAGANGEREEEPRPATTSAFLLGQDPSSSAPTTHTTRYGPVLIGVGEVAWPVEPSSQFELAGGQREGQGAESTSAAAPADAADASASLALIDPTQTLASDSADERLFAAASSSSSSSYLYVDADEPQPLPHSPQAHTLHVEPSASPEAEVLARSPCASDGLAPATEGGASSATTATAAAASAAPSDSAGPALSSRPPSFAPGAFFHWLRPWLSQPVFHAALVAGFASGFLNGLFGTGGPPIMMLFACIAIGKGEVRGTSVWAGLLRIVPAFISLLVFGIFRADDWPIYLLLPLFCVAGTAAGNKAHAHVDVNVVMLVMQGLVLLSTVSLTDAMGGEPFGNLMLVAYATVVVAGAAFAVYLSSMHYRFLRERPHLAPLWADREQAMKHAKKAAHAHSHSDADGSNTFHPMLLLPDGSPGNYTSWHE